MGYKLSVLTKEQVELILTLAREGRQAKEIARTLKKEGKIPEHVKYMTIAYHVRKVNKRISSRKAAAEVNAIESITELTKFMTRIATKLEKRFDKAEDTKEQQAWTYHINKLIGHYVDLFKPSTGGAPPQVNIGIQNLQKAYDEVVAENATKLRIPATKKAD